MERSYIQETLIPLWKQCNLKLNTMEQHLQLLYILFDIKRQVVVKHRSSASSSEYLSKIKIYLKTLAGR